MNKKESISHQLVKQEVIFMTLESLTKNGILRFAKEPKNNPQDLDFEYYTVPLVEHDYPAKTPIMWNAAYEAFGMSVRNIMMVGSPGQSNEIFTALREDKKYKGGGAGVGFKDESIQYLDELDSLAKEIGAVNFILKTAEEKLRGFNTDGLGYAQSLEDILQKRKETLAGKKVVILGAGGAGNAVAFALAAKGAKIVILNRTAAKARVLAENINRYLKLTGDFSVRFGGEDAIQHEIQDADVVVNVSTKGSAGDLERYSALAPARQPKTDKNIQDNLRQAEKVLQIMPKKAVISDIVLGKASTPLLKMAHDAGFEILDGIPMVVNQGAEAFWLLHGEYLKRRNISKEEVRRIMREAAFKK